MSIAIADRVSERTAAPELTLEERYQRELAITGRLSDWLTSPEFQLLSVEEQERVYVDYQGQLRKLRQLAEERRPTALRARDESLAGADLHAEVLELFAL
ncbi:MAG: hypothetical protein HY320_00100 [Armatimonadetes bacterium]|nr:hypothetical protein [Armatimonadota bacterium]